jgi:hypothetical protein
LKQQILSILTTISVATALTPQKPAQAGPAAPVFLIAGVSGRMAVIAGTVIGIQRGCAYIQSASNVSCGTIAITVYNGVRQYYAPIYPRGDFQRPNNGRWM